MPSVYIDLPCPYCGPSRRSPANRVRKVMRVYDHGGYKAFFCARCESKGILDGDIAIVPAPQQSKDSRSAAQYLWEKAVPFDGTLAETYLAQRKCSGSWPFRFLPRSEKYPAAMVAKFENGAVHLTKFAEERAKIIVGSCRGSFIKIKSDPEASDLTITEGIEDACSVALHIGGEVWAAGFAGNIPYVADQAKHERVFVVTDKDLAAKRALSKITRPIIPVRVWRVSQYEDANAMIMAGGNLSRVFEMAHFSQRMRDGTISFSAYQKAINGAM